MKTFYDFNNTEKIILRDYLALERTRLANERTLFSYVRTSLYLLLGGIAFLQLHEFENLWWLGYLSFVVSAGCLLIGVFKFYQVRNRLRKYYVRIHETDGGENVPDV
jgi:putative membrane protein